MKQWKTEYKILLFFGVLFVIVLVFYLVQSGTLVGWITGVKKGQYINCTEQDYQKGISYTEHRCTIGDEVGNTYTLSYPQINIDQPDIQNLNTLLRANFDTVYQSIEYGQDIRKLVLDSYTSTNYAIYQNDRVASLLVTDTEVAGSNITVSNQYRAYNIEITTGNLLDDEEMRNMYGLDLSFSSQLRAEIVKMYATEFGYNYYGELPQFRNQNIDDSITSITISSVSNIYIGPDGNIHFFIKLYHPSYFTEISYRITVDNGQNIQYEIAL